MHIERILPSTRVGDPDNPFEVKLNGGAVKSGHGTTFTDTWA